MAVWLYRRFVVGTAGILFVLIFTSVTNLQLSSHVPPTRNDSPPTTLSNRPNLPITGSLPKMFNTTATKCPGVLEAYKDPPYTSQQREDNILMEWFATLCGGTYVELGALDGILYSNTYVFNTVLKWKGVLIELMPHHYESLSKNRAMEIATVHSGVCSYPRKLHFFGRRPATGGIYEFTTPEFRKKWWDDVAVDHPSVKEIDCDALDALLRKYAPENDYFDFLSLDVEGSELEALMSIDFDRVGFGIIFAEAEEHNHLKNLAVRQFMASRGYSFLQESAGSQWFVNGDFHRIYYDLLY
ncbi:hypothetical protein ACHAWF_011505 [Thalassiosira exigua]